MRLIITDVTEMGGGNYCVAGWCPATASMVRPLPNGSNWSSRMITVYGIVPGLILQVQPNGQNPNGLYPHRTEDVPINPIVTPLANQAAPPWLSSAAPARAATIQAAFDNSVHHNSQWNGRLQGVHVAEGALCRSLWGLEISRQSVSFTTDFDKLKAVIHDGDSEYLLSVSARNLKETYRAGGDQAVTNLLPQGGRLHIRLGLARAWDGQPGKCYLMLNGVYW